eukprot:PLAT6977.1.p1 GENE.PLAT6977.1~~PLAT6977.1.p1  ORF type:complete len:559 (+),score=141.83 PLAT6977.1:55-1731(+)
MQEADRELESLADGHGDEERPSFTMEEAITSLGFGSFHLKLLALAGSCWMADAMETMLLTFLLPAVQCEWDLDSTMTASIATAVFIGMLAGSALWGAAADRIGRRRVYLLSNLLTGVAGLASAASTGGWMLLLLRVVVGVGISGSHVAFTLYSEFLTPAKRGKQLLYMELFWGFGSIVEGLIAWLVLPVSGWRMLLIVSAMPFVILSALYAFVPESPRYLMSKDRGNEALAVLRQVAAQHKQRLPRGRLIIPTTPKPHWDDFFHPLLRRTTLLVIMLWVLSGFSYYGVILLTPALINQSKALDERAADALASAGEAGMGSEATAHIADACQLPSSDMFLSIVVSSVGELPGILLLAVLINRIGRRKSILASYLPSALLMFAMLIGPSEVLMTVLLFCVRGLVVAGFQVVYLYTPEVFPTSIRASAVGISSSASRIGSMLTPFVAEELTGSQLYAAVIVYAIIFLFAAVLGVVLPYETMGRTMPSSLSDLRVWKGGPRLLRGTALSDDTSDEDVGAAVDDDDGHDSDAVELTVIKKRKGGKPGGKKKKEKKDMVVEEEV